VIAVEFDYKIEKDIVSVWVHDEKTGKKLASLQLPRKDVEYVARRAMKELDINEEDAYNLSVYLNYVRVTWGLL